MKAKKTATSGISVINQALEKTIRARTAENIRTVVGAAGSQLTVVRLALDGLADLAKSSTINEQDLRDVSTTVEGIQNELDNLSYLGLK